MITTEIRIFLTEPDNYIEELQNVFNLKPEGERTDYYRRWQQSQTCGVKISRGRLEVKALISDADTEMPLQNWEKLRFEEPEVSSDEYIGVKKTKWANYFNEAVEEVSDDAEELCKLEWSEVEAGGQNFYSICLAAEGGNEQQRVKKAVRLWEELKAKMPDFRAMLEERRPLSYPEFLAERSF